MPSQEYGYTRSQDCRTDSGTAPRDGPNEPSQPAIASAVTRTGDPEDDVKVTDGRSEVRSCSAVSATS